MGEGDLTVTVMAERSAFAPQGLFGGEPGRPAHFLVGEGREQHRHSSKFSARVPAGTRVSLQLGGGGGYGPPLEREPGAVAADVAAGRVSRRRAGQAYGVVLRRDGTPDEAKTRERRRALRAAADATGAR